MEVKNVCLKCGEVNEINSFNLKKEQCHTIEGDFVQLMYYQCKRCKERMVVQIDDSETMRLSREHKKLFIKMSKKSLKHETVSPKDIKKRAKLSKEINEKRKALEEKYNGRMILDENENIFTEHLTFGKEGDIIESSTM